MAKDEKPDTPAAEPAPVATITVTSLVDGYERCGVEWMREPRTVEVAVFSDIDLRSLRLDPTLTVVDV
jgi:hypothetical protein